MRSPVAVLVAADADASRVRERMARATQLLAGRAERGERDVVERGARDQELAEQPEHERHRRRRVGGEEVAPADLLERVGDVDVGLRQHTPSRALEDVERVGVDGRRCQPRGIPSTRSARIWRWIS